jgi:hypothetical protein
MNIPACADAAGTTTWFLAFNLQGCSPTACALPLKKRDFGASQPAARKQNYISSRHESMSDCGPTLTFREA